MRKQECSIFPNTKECRGWRQGYILYIPKCSQENILKCVIDLDLKFKLKKIYICLSMVVKVKLDAAVQRAPRGRAVGDARPRFAEPHRYQAFRTHALGGLINEQKKTMT